MAVYRTVTLPYKKNSVSNILGGIRGTGWEHHTVSLTRPFSTPYNIEEITQKTVSIITSKTTECKQQADSVVFSAKSPSGYVLSKIPVRLYSH